MTRARRANPLPVAVVTATLLLLGGCGATSGSPGSAGPPNSARSTATPPPPAATSPPSPSPDRFVETDGRDFVLNGRPFRFVGVNIYDAASSGRYSCREGSRMSDEELLETLRYLRDEAGVTVLRFWAYQTYTQGATYWVGVDRVLAAARATGMKVIPVLEDGPGDCTTAEGSASKAEHKGDTWYSQGYREPYGSATLSYRDYVARITAHYADEPVILGWSMMNEADTDATDSLLRPVLVGFARDVAGVIRRADERHLITVGTQSNGAPGASGPDFTAVYGLDEISFSEVHDWGYWGSDTAPMPGGTGATPPRPDSIACLPRNAPIGCSFARAAALDKPLLVGEAGMRGTTAGERDVRAGRLRAKMDAAFASGASGYLIWGVTTEPTDGYDLLTTTDDPLVEQLRLVAEDVR